MEVRVAKGAKIEIEGVGTGRVRSPHVNLDSSSFSTKACGRGRCVSPAPLVGVIRVKLEKIGLEAVRDLLFHLPLRYEDRTKVSPIGGLQPGMDVVLHARIALSQVKFGRRRSLVVRIQDSTGQLDLRFFHFSESQRRGLAQGKWIYCYGQVRRGPVGLELVHPEYQLLAEHDTPPPRHFNAGLPNYRWPGQGVGRLCGKPAPKRAAQRLVRGFRLCNMPSLLEAIKHRHHPP